MEANDELQSFLVLVERSLRSSDDWLEREIIFACAAGVCGAYYKLGFALNEQQILVLAARLFRYYTETLRKSPYLERLTKASFDHGMFTATLSNVCFLPEPVKDLPELNGVFPGVAQHVLDSVMFRTLEEIVLEQIINSFISFRNSRSEKVLQ
ncbi:hypothetical protein [Desulforamulus ruminis]|uniref:Uncharacterized protein n=1 Tax=Desulforamulus ruminis (strain ATCC 23193 / DSM 2154 / NCIMB 8452 / DL) TaxID=696281 RepID=F6DS65_DESRL|nr:hypothetical protein [Desulforamulus ruminis]AEG58827.1 hypothetical protein Desru_0541 [Desulforamulus ruminis DSM 2154]